MTASPAPRLLAIGLLAVALVGLFVLGGTGWPAPADSGPDEEALAEDYAGHVGEEVQLGGTVVETDPTVIEVEHDHGVFELEVDNAPAAEDAEPGEELILAGELAPDHTLDAAPGRTVVRQPWEVAYMYAISVFGVLLVAGRLADGWRFDARRLVFTPRETPLRTRLRDRLRDRFWDRLRDRAGDDGHPAPDGGEGDG